METTHRDEEEKFDRMVKQKDAEIEYVKQQLAESEETATKYDEERREIEKTVRDKNVEINAIEARERIANHRIADLEQMVKDLDKTADKRAATIKRQAGENDKLKTQSAKINDEQKKLRNDAENLAKEKERAAGLEKMLQDEIASLREQNEVLSVVEAENEELKATMDDLTARVATLTENYRELESMVVVPGPGDEDSDNDEEEEQAEPLSAQSGGFDFENLDDNNDDDDESDAEGDGGPSRRQSKKDEDTEKGKATSQTLTLTLPSTNVDIAPVEAPQATPPSLTTTTIAVVADIEPVAIAPEIRPIIGAGFPGAATGQPLNETPQPVVVLDEFPPPSQFLDFVRSLLPASVEIPANVSVPAAPVAPVAPAVPATPAAPQAPEHSVEAIQTGKPAKGERESSKPVQSGRTAQKGRASTRDQSAQTHPAPNVEFSFIPTDCHYAFNPLMWWYAVYYELFWAIVIPYINRFRSKRRQLTNRRPKLVEGRSIPRPITFKDFEKGALWQTNDPNHKSGLHIDAFQAISLRSNVIMLVFHLALYALIAWAFSVIRERNIWFGANELTRQYVDNHRNRCAPHMDHGFVGYVASFLPFEPKWSFENLRYEITSRYKIDRSFPG